MAQEQQAQTDPSAKTGTPTAEDIARYRGGLARTLVRTLLIFTFIPLVLMGAAAYWRARTLLQDQAVAQMRAQIVDQVGDVNLAIKTKRIRLDRLVRNTAFQSVVQSAVRADGVGTDSLRTDMNALVRGLSQEGGQATFNHYFLMDPTGKVVLSSDPEWAGVQLNDQPAFATLAQSDHTSFTYYSFPPLYEDELVLLTISQVRGPGAVPVGTMVGITESGELEAILRSLASASAGAEALFVTEDGRLIGTDPYTNEITLVQPPAEQVAPIVAQLDRMMGQNNPPPASVAFRAEDGTRYFGQVLWLEILHAGILYQIGERLVFGALASLLPFTILVILVSLAAMGVVLTLGARRVFRPLADLADITDRFAAGDFAQRAAARTKDEIGLLAQSFNRMAEDLSGLYRSLEERVEQRTRQMRTAADVAERITSTTNLGELLNRTAQLLIEQFNFYQASIFLLDRTHRFAVLRASFGPGANDMLSKGHRLEVGSASIIGWVTANNQPRIAADVTEDPVHMRNPLLPETRSEAGIPIRAGNTVLGALDVQSTEPRAFGPDTIVMLQTLANQIAAAVQNMTLAEASQTNMQELERLYDASRKIFSSQTREQVLARSAEQVAEASFPALLLTVKGQQLELQGRPDMQRPDIAGIVQALPVLESHLAEVRRYVSGGPVIAEQSSLGLPLALLDFTRQVGHRSVAFLPINHREELAGLLIVSNPNRPLSSALVEPYAGLADLVGVCLDRLADTEETERRLVERDALSKISRAVAQSTEDLGAFFGELHNQVRANIGEYAFVVALFDVAHDALSIPYAYQEGRLEKIEAFPLGEGLTSILIRTGQPLLLADDVERRTQRLGARTVGRPARSWMGAPMLIENKPIGALIIQDLERENSFTDRNLSFLVELAAQVAVVVTTARLLDQSRRHAYQLEATAEIARDMSGSLNLDELLLKAVNYMRDRLGFYHASVFLLDPKREFAVVRESTGEAGVQLKRVGHKLAVNSRSIVGFVAGRGEPLIVGDISKDPTYFPNPLLAETRSEAAVPLRVGERIVGVMDVQSSNLHAFEEEDVRTLQILADQLAVAVVNSELFAETQEHLSQQRLLQHITTAAASGTTLEEALDGAVTGLQVTLGGDRVSILLLNRESQRLEIRAAVGYSDAIFGLQIPVGSGITGWSAAHARALRVDDVSGDSRYVEGSPNTRAELAVPLLYRNEVLGVLNVESEQLAAYGDSDEEMLTTLAGSLAAVIANARLLEQVRAQAERERVLFEITSKIRRAPDIQAILATTASELTRVVGAQRAKIRVTYKETNGEAAEEE